MKDKKNVILIVVFLIGVIVIGIPIVKTSSNLNKAITQVKDNFEEENRIVEKEGKEIDSNTDSESELADKEHEQYSIENTKEIDMYPLEELVVNKTFKSFNNTFKEMSSVSNYREVTLNGISQLTKQKHEGFEEIIEFNYKDNSFIRILVCEKEEDTPTLEKMVFMSFKISPELGEIHNVNGKKYAVGCSQWDDNVNKYEIAYIYKNLAIEISSIYNKNLTDAIENINKLIYVLAEEIKNAS